MDMNTMEWMLTLKSVNTPLYSSINNTWIAGSDIAVIRKIEHGIAGDVECKIKRRCETP